MRLLSKKQQKTSTPRRRASDAGSSRARSTRDQVVSTYSFRRNRTLTGSLHPDVASAAEYSSQLKSSRVQAHSLRKHRRNIGWALAGAVAASVVLVLLIGEFIAMPRVIIADAEVSEEVRSQYESHIQEYLNQHPTERLRFMLDIDRLTRFLAEGAYPEVEHINPTPESAGIATKQFTIYTRAPVVSWRTEGEVLYVDASGVAFRRNYLAQPSVEVVDESGIEARDNQILASDKLLGFIGRTIGAMERYEFTVEKIILPRNTTRQIEVVLKEVPYPVKLSVDRQVGEQSEDAARAIMYLHEQSIAPQYLDVRVSGRAFYR